MFAGNQITSKEVKKMKKVSLLRMISVIFLVVSIVLNGFTHVSFAQETGHVKHIILFIGDGMQLEHEIATSRYLYGKNYNLSFHKFPYKTFVSTWDVTTYDRYAYSLRDPYYDPDYIIPKIGYDPCRGGKKPFPLDKSIDDSYFLTKLIRWPDDTPKYPATDSASAGTAISTGYKTDDGNIAWLPGDPGEGGNRRDDGSLKTIAEILREEKGYSIGVVSTVPFSHATPASFVSHNKSRNNYYAIADEIIRETKPEVVIGGGHPSWDNTFMSEELYNDLKNGLISDYVFVERTTGVDGGEAIINGAELAVSQGKKLFGLFGGNDGNFEPPVPLDTPGSPFIVRATIENPTLKDATIAALKVLSQDEDGFFLMVEQGDIDWANHANNYRWMVGTVWDLDNAVSAAKDFVNQPGDNLDWSNTVIIVTSDHGNSYMRLTNNPRLRVGDLPEQVGEDYAWSYPGGEVTYQTTNHTNELVTLYAIGKGEGKFKKYEGKWYPRTRIIDNTHIFHAMADMAGVSKESPLRVIVLKPFICSNISNGE